MIKRREFLRQGVTAGAMVSLQKTLHVRAAPWHFPANLPRRTDAPLGEVAMWEAGNPIRSSGISLLRGKLAEWNVHKEEERYFASIVPVSDYYRRAAFILRFDKAPERESWLVIEYLDQGYALISLNRRLPQVDQWNVARLNTGRLRQAVFRLDSAMLDSPLRIYGVERLHSIRLLTTSPQIEPTPSVAPAITLRRPIQLVTSAGADADRPEGLPDALASVRNQLPLVKALGFQAVESYVKWDFVEPSPGVFDWSFYDAIVDEIDRHGLKWFPLLVAGPAYTLPTWFHDSLENCGYVCLEHGIENDIQTIFSGCLNKYVQRFLEEFGKHYGSRKTLLGVRLGPSGNYGETQYPASGPNMGYHHRPLHTHIGYWAADPFAGINFRRWIEARYGKVAKLNEAWTDQMASLDEVKPFLPAEDTPARKRLDFCDWYLAEMNNWSNQCAEWARQAMPDIPIYQSCGGSGQIPVGTDFVYNAQSTAKIRGGVRVTNQGDEYGENFAITRLCASSTRFYGADFALEPAGFGSARGDMARLFSAIATGAQHLFYYGSNLTGNDQAINAWLRYASLLDQRSKPMIDIALFYPDTAIKLEDDALSTLLSRAAEMRSVTDFDYVSEQMVLDGALDRYKVLMFMPGVGYGRFRSLVAEKPVVDRMGHWIEGGGVVIYAVGRRGYAIRTVEGDTSVSRRWQEQPTTSRVVRYDLVAREPFKMYLDFLRTELRKRTELRAPLRSALKMEKPASVYWSVLSDGQLALLNFSGTQARVNLDGGQLLVLDPYSVTVKGRQSMETP